MSNPYIGLQNDLVYALNQIVTGPGSLGIGLVKDEGKVRVVITGAGPSNLVRIRGRINNQDTWDTLAEFTGNVNELVEVFTYDQLEALCIVFEATNGYDFKIVASSFDSNKLTIETPDGTLDNFNTLTFESSDNSIDIVADPLTGTIDFTTGETTGVTSVNGRTGDVILDKSDVNLDQVDNTSDADKPISDDTQDALDLKIDLLEKGAADGVAPLNSSSKIDAIYLPSYVDDVVEVADYASLPIPGEDGKIYVTLDTNKIYRWSGSLYIEIAENKSIWGSITGLLSNQLDLQSELDGKVADTGDTMTGPLNMSALGENIQFSVYGLNASSGMEIRTDDQTTRSSGNLKLETGDSKASDSTGAIYLTAGNNVDGNPGNILITSGQSSGTGPDGVIILDSKGVVYLNQNLSGYIDAVNHHIQNVLDPVSDQDAATKKWVEQISALTSVLVVDASSNPFGADGSLFKPYSTIADALLAATDGTTILLMPGTYSESTVVIPSSLSNITIIGYSRDNTSISNGISYTAAANSISINFEKIAASQFTLDNSLAINGICSLKEVSGSIVRTDSNSNVFCITSESLCIGGTIDGGSNNLSECLILAPLTINAGLSILENCKFVSTVEAFGSSSVRLLDCEIFGAPYFVNGAIVSGDTPTIEIDAASDALGTLSGDYNKILLAQIPLSNITQSSASNGEVPIWNGTSWEPGVPNLATTWGEISGNLEDQTDLQTTLDGKVSDTGDTMTGTLTMLDTAIVVDGTITQGYPSTVTVATNNILLLDTSGVDNKETSISSGIVGLARTNVASSTSDTTMVISTDEGAAYLLANTTDYANDASSQLALNLQSLSISGNDNVSGISTTGAYGSGSFIIQTTQPDSSYTAIEGSDTGVTATQYDGVSTTPLMPVLPEHYTVKEYVDNLVSSGEAGVLEKFEIMKEPNGFPNRTDSTTSFVNASREFTIAPVGASFDVYVKSQKFTKSTAETLEIPNMSGNHYIFYNDTGVLSSTQVLSTDLFQNNALISIIYWNSETSSHVYFAEERHGVTMDGATHTYLHTVFGARYLSGLALQNFSVNGDGNSASHAQFTSDSGSIRDEDLLITILAQSQIPVLYQQGNLWRKKPADSFPVIYSGTAGYTGASGRLPFNEYTGGAWQLTEIPNNGFVLVHVFATNDKDSPVVAVQGIATYGNVTAARIAASSEITSLSGLPFAEFVALGSVVFESTSTFTNTPKAAIRSVNGGNYVDFRGTQLYTPAGEATTHSLLSGLAGDDHIQYHTDARGDARYNLKSVGDISETSFSITNNEPLQTNVVGLSFDNVLVRSFQVILSVKIDATIDLSEVFELIGINKNGSFNMSVSSVGDDSGVVFSITSTGQIQYTSQNYTGFVSGTIKFRAITTSI